MGIFPDSWIRTEAIERGMIEPFAARRIRDGVSSYGGAAEVGREVGIFTNVDSAWPEVSSVDCWSKSMRRSGVTPPPL